MTWGPFRFVVEIAAVSAMTLGMTVAGAAIAGETGGVIGLLIGVLLSGVIIVRAAGGE